MSLLVAEPDVAKKQAGKSSVVKRDDTSIRMSRRVAEIASKAAALKGKSLGLYLAEIVEPIATRDLKAEAKKIAGSKGDG